MFQDSEIVNLALGIISLLVIISVFMKKSRERLHYFYIGFFFVFSALFCTVIEGVFWHELFDDLEHLSYAISSVFFAAGVFRISRKTEQDGGGSE